MPPTTGPKPLYELKKPAEIQNTTVTPAVKATITILEQAYPKEQSEWCSFYSLGYVATVKGIKEVPETTHVFVKIYLPDRAYEDGNDEARADREILAYQHFPQYQKDGSIPTLYGRGKFHFTNVGTGQKSPPLIILSIAPGVPLKKFETNPQVKSGWTRQKLSDLYTTIKPIFEAFHKEFQKYDVQSFHVDPKTGRPCIFDFDRIILKTEGNFDPAQDVQSLFALLRGIAETWGLQ